jgi:hypothetical protein
MNGMRMKRISSLAVAGVMAAALLGSMGATASADDDLTHLGGHSDRSHPHDDTPAAKELIDRGYLVRDPAAYDDAKGNGNGNGNGNAGGGGAPHRTLSPLGLAGGTTTNPVVVKGWAGQYDVAGSPGDTTGAAGPLRVVEMVNQKFGVYSRTGSVYSSGTLAQMTGDTAGVLTNPQVIWDPGTNRFYYTVLNFSYNVLDIGFSKTSTPGVLTDWCRYQIDYGYGAYLPAFPRLGDTADFLLLGVNVFAPTGAYVRSDVDWVSKPPAGTTCATSLGLGVVPGVKNADGTPMFTPVPANQTDTSSQGWIVSARDVTPGPAGDLSVLSVTRNPDGTPNIPTTASSISVPSYALPPSAPQGGTTSTFDTMDGRLTQAVSAIDPSHGSVDAVWMQHTVKSADGLRSEVRWYEIDPATRSIVQSGATSSTTLYTFNGAISPDRLVNGTTAKFGDSMVLNFDSSSATTYVTIQMVSKRAGATAQSPFVKVYASTGKNLDAGCTPRCRWGDYAGATPDPGASATGVRGQVLGVNLWNTASRTDADYDWRSQIFLTSP